jgi:hypothetical protein
MGYKNLKCFKLLKLNSKIWSLTQKGFEGIQLNCFVFLHIKCIMEADVSLLTLDRTEQLSNIQMDGSCLSAITKAESADSAIWLLESSDICSVKSMYLFFFSFLFFFKVFILKSVGQDRGLATSAYAIA